MLAKDVMKTPVVTVKPTDTLRTAAATLAANRISGAPVVDDGGRLLGMLTEHDLIRKSQELRVGLTRDPFGWISPHTAPDEIASFTRGLCTVADVLVEQAMTSKVLSVDENDPIESVAQLMLRRKINRVPVLADGKLVGIITRADLVWAMVNLCEIPSQT